MEDFIIGAVCLWAFGCVTGAGFYAWLTAPPKRPPLLAGTMHIMYDGQEVELLSIDRTPDGMIAKYKDQKGRVFQAHPDTFKAATTTVVRHNVAPPGALSDHNDSANAFQARRPRGPN